MDGEAVREIATLAQVKQFKIGNVDYTTEPLTQVMPALPQILKVKTLQGLVDALPADLDQIFIHVEDHQKVIAYNRAPDEHGRIIAHVQAEPVTYEVFRFCHYLDAETFAITISCMFQNVKIDGQENDLEYLLKLASNISATEELTIADDGISQRAATNAGIVLKGHTTVRNRVNLAPFRTFPELDQPVSEFLFRLKKTDNGVLCALFPTDGGRWKLSAQTEIDNYLRKCLSGRTVKIVF